MFTTQSDDGNMSDTNSGNEETGIDAAADALIARVKMDMVSNPPLREEAMEIINEWCEEHLARQSHYDVMNQQHLDFVDAGPPPGMNKTAFRKACGAKGAAKKAYKSANFIYTRKSMDQVVQRARDMLKATNDPLGGYHETEIGANGKPKMIFVWADSKAQRVEYQERVDGLRTGEHATYNFAPWTNYARATVKTQLAAAKFNWALAAVSALLLTGRRECEILASEFKWEMVEGEEHILRVDHLSKADKKEPFDVDCLGDSQDVFDIIAKIRESQGDLTIAQVNERTTALNTAFRRIALFKEFREVFKGKHGREMTVHDLRRVYIAYWTAVEDPEWPEDVGNRKLGHKTLAATRIYTTLKCVFEKEEEEEGKVVEVEKENVEPPSKKQKMSDSRHNKTTPSEAAENSDESGGTADSRDTIVRTRGPRERREFSGTQCPRLGIDGYCGLCNQIRDKIEANTVIKEKMIKFLADLI